MSRYSIVRLTHVNLVHPTSGRRKTHVTAAVRSGQAPATERSPNGCRAVAGVVCAVSLRMSVIGCGYLGAVHAAAMASIGHDVIGIDVDERKVAALNAGSAPFFEPQLTELLTEGREPG